MKKFIEIVIDNIFEDGNNDYSDIAIIFPNRRPAAFLKNELGKLIDVPFFPPVCFSIRDFVFQYSGYQRAENLQLLFKLYDVYVSINAQKQDLYSFEQFVSSAELMLIDFNDIDNYLIKPEKLFSNLEEARAIELWNPGKDKLTEMEKAYLDFYKSLIKYYSAFQKSLSEDNIAYDGMAFREFAENIHTLCLENTFKKIVFAGFNAITPAEEKIINYFVNKKIATIVWNDDKYYVDNKYHEAGFFLRNNFNKWNKNSIRSSISNESMIDTQKEITIIGAPLSISQTKICGQIINELFDVNKKLSGEEKNKKLINTAIIPGNIDLTTEILKSIPAHIENINVTMGLPITKSAAYELVVKFVSLHVNSFKNRESNQNMKFYYKDILQYITCPYFDYQNKDVLQSGEKIAAEILKRNRKFYSKNELLNILSGDNNIEQNIKQLIDTNFHECQNIKELTQLCSALCQTLADNLSSSDQLTSYIFSSLSNVMLEISEYIDSVKFKLNPTSFALLFKRLSSMIEIHTEGEPLKGLQVMGMLETRCLDFKNIIITNVNEGFLPEGTRNFLTFIPFDIRKSFGLPLPKHKEAIYSYYFYRLLQNAEKVYLIYNTEPDLFSGKEKSRFIKQILYELHPKTTGNWKISHKILKIDNNGQLINLPDKHEIFKNEKIMEMLINNASQGFSPSRLWDYIECPFRFYLKHLLKIDEDIEDIEETMEAKTMGNVIHDAIERIYKDANNIVLDKYFYERALSALPDLLNKIFEKHYREGSMDEGVNLLIYEISKKMIENHLNFEKKEVENGKKIIPLFQEKDLDYTLFKTTNNIQVNIHGKIDYIALCDGNLRVLDFKTGEVKSLNLSKKKEIIFENIIHSLNNQKFQLLMYLLLVKKSELSELKPYNNNKIYSGIIPLKSGVPAPHYLKTSQWETSSIIDAPILDEFSKYLEGLITEILNEEIPFYLSEDNKACEYCIYSGICNKDKR